MIPQKQVNEILPEEQVQPPVEKKKAWLSVKEGATPILVLGAIVLFVAGAWYHPLLGGMTAGIWFLLGVLFAFAGGLVCGMLTRSYWSLLAVSFPLLLGLLIGGSNYNELDTVNYTEYIAKAFTDTSLIYLFPAAALVGAVIGRTIGLRLELRQTKRSIHE
jgi:hypothetical protein